MPPSRTEIPKSSGSALPTSDRSGKYLAPQFSVRVTELAALLSLELVAVSVWLDAADLRGGQGLVSWVHRFGPGTARVIVASVFFAIFFAQSQPVPDEKRRDSLRSTSLSGRILAGHGVVFLVFLSLSYALFKLHPAGVFGDLTASAWLIAGLSSVLLAAAAFVPAAAWLHFLRRNLTACSFALAAGVIAYFLGNASRDLWQPLTRITFAAVQAILRAFLPALISDPSALTIGTQRFLVEIAPECSGYEGIGLVLAFCSAWLWLLRSEWRFPQALLLLPIGAAAIWVANVVRIAALILIGHAGAARIALGGFHSQGGWIAFTAVTIGVCFTGRRVQWLNRNPLQAGSVWKDFLSNPANPYLLPLLVFLGASLVSKSLTADVEWFYLLRVIAGGAVLWMFRREYAKLDWRPGWEAFAIGGLVFLLWIAFSSAHLAPDSRFPSQLTQSGWFLQFGWLACRAAGALAIGPACEELAYREFALLRMTTRTLAQPGWRSVPWFALVASSLAYGFLQGQQWAVGTVAGLLFGFAFLRRRRIGDAFSAHATANALIIAWILVGHNWSLWP